MKADDTKRLTELGKENATRKRLLADAGLEEAALKAIREGNSEPGTQAGDRRPPGPVLGVIQRFACRAIGQTRRMQRRPPRDQIPIEPDAWNKPP